MNNHDPRVKRAPKELWLYRNCTDSRYRPLAQERQILEMIVLGAPLPIILNKLCTVIDLEIGNSVSVVSLSDERESHFGPKAQMAMQVGLELFSSTEIFSRTKTVMGILEIYVCDSRLPTPQENQLIERVARLVVIGLQRDKDAEELERSSRNSLREMDADATEKPPLIN